MDSNSQEAIDDRIHHQADCIHMRGNHDTGSWLTTGTLLQPMQAAQSTGAQLIGDRFPGFLNDRTDTVFVAAKTWCGD